ncbi:hypothetical protein [Longimicrobium sp.]|uniref:hypothetical protein n=1 Tax=Longimicrobium sp. TaxID=2029185 RepID=UPI002E31EB47|nr:hypothetical protein [Longimicrobium sp.]HEX6038537.1 hypothetical protein [Longimicrobium sp.]
MRDPEEITNIRIRPRAAEPVTLPIPVQTMDLVRRVATTRDMSAEELLKFYIGQGLRQDAARLFSERILETTAEVLARHIPSEEERSAILREIRGEAAA